MGWLFFPRPENETPAEICARRGLRWSLPEDAQPKIVKSVTTNEAVFFAVKFPAAFQALQGKTWCDGYQRAADGSFTGALIYLYKSDKREFGYKDIDETMGPNVTAPSKAFLDALSPLTPRNDGNRHAHDWRARSLQEIAEASALRRKRDNLKDGDLVRLPIPLRFSDGASRDEFRAERHQRRGQTKLYFRSLDGLLCRLTAKQFATAAVNPPPRAPVAAAAAEAGPTRRAEGLMDQADALRAGKHGVFALTGALSDVVRDDGVWRGKLRLDDLQGVIGVRFVHPIFQDPEQFAGARVTVYCGPTLPERPLEVDALLIEEAEPRLDAGFTAREETLQEEMDLGSGEAPSL